MSGIAGMVNPSEDLPLQSVNICAMSDAIRSRGANGAGHFLSSRSVLLKRVGWISPKHDSATVTQLCVDGRTYVLTLDGVLYNEEELRAQIEARGFKCTTCPEIFIYAYSLWKDGFLNKFNGIFAFALWNVEEQTLILARDQLGVKPLFYALKGRTLLFASEIQGITSHPLFETSMDLEGLSELICLSPRHTPGSTVIKGIHQVRPGHFVRYSSEGLKSVRYWRIEKQEHEDDLSKTLETVRELVIQSVRRQMKSHIPLCGLLSGGLYSSLITAIVTDYPQDLYCSVYNTWSVDFERNNRYIRHRTLSGDSDTPWVRWVCRRTGTRHHYIILSSNDLVEALLDATEARGIPGMPEYDSSLLLLCREIRKDFGIVLTGDCSDEVFGANIRSSEYFASGKKRLPWASNVAEKISVFKSDLIDVIKPYEFIEKCYAEALAEYLKFTSDTQRLKKETEAQWFSLYWNLPCLLERLDRMGMAFGLETRVPFCDVRLVEYFWNIPQEIKRLNNMDRGLLREAMRGYLPSDILERKKSPFPRSQDPEYEAKIKNILSEKVLDPGSPIKNLLNLKTLESMMKQNDIHRPYSTRAQLFGWMIQLDHFMRLNGITSV